jgi:hypothetical protein
LYHAGVSFCWNRCIRRKMDVLEHPLIDPRVELRVYKWVPYPEISFAVDSLFEYCGKSVE